jgi:hypothetical protein
MQVRANVKPHRRDALLRAGCAHRVWIAHNTGCRPFATYFAPLYFAPLYFAI